MYLRKHLKIDLYDLCALGIILFAILLRLILIGVGWPPTDSDESTIGLMALHIAYHGETPVFFYGQGYMGTLEAYLPALLFSLFGPSLFLIRLSMLSLVGLFFVSMYFLTSLLYTRKLAMVTLILLSLGSSGILFVELRAIGGYGETLLLSALLLLIASYLALSFRPVMSRKRRWWRLLGYACWGYLVGFGMYTDQLIVPFVLMSALLLLLFCWPDLDSLAPTFIIASFTLGLLPLFIYNITELPQEGTFYYFLRVYRSDVTDPTIISQITPLNKVVGALLVGLPNLTGENPICSPQNLPLFGLLSPTSISCTLMQGSWSIGCIVLWVIAVVITVKALRKQQVLGKHGFNLEYSEARQLTIRYVAQLALLGSAALTLLLFALSPVAALDPWENSRYLFCLLTATPAIIDPLQGRTFFSFIGWLTRKQVMRNIPQRQLQAQTSLTSQDIQHEPDAQQTVHIAPSASPATTTSRIHLVRERLAEIVRVGILLYICIMLGLGVINTFTQIPSTKAMNKQQSELIYKLEQIGATRIYSEYWTCNRIIFLSRERIICSVLGDTLHGGYNRYPPYYDMVHRVSDEAAYVLPIGSPVDISFKRRLPHLHKRYHHIFFAGYDIYQPVM